MKNAITKREFIKRGALFLTAVGISGIGAWKISNQLNDSEKVTRKHLLKVEGAIGSFLAGLEARSPGSVFVTGGTVCALLSGVIPGEMTVLFQGGNKRVVKEVIEGAGVPYLPHVSAGVPGMDGAMAYVMDGSVVRVIVVPVEAYLERQMMWGARKDFPFRHSSLLYKVSDGSLFDPTSLLEEGGQVAVQLRYPIKGVRDGFRTILQGELDSVNFNIPKAKSFEENGKSILDYTVGSRALSHQLIAELIIAGSKLVDYGERERALSFADSKLMHSAYSNCAKTALARYDSVSKAYESISIAGTSDSARYISAVLVAASLGKDARIPVEALLLGNRNAHPELGHIVDGMHIADRNLTHG